MNGPPETNGTRPSDIPSLAPSSAALTRGHSCQRCQRRKIKCDGRDPCHSCSKSGSDCIRRAKNRTVGGRITKASRSVEFPQTVRRTQSPPPPDDFRHELHLVPPPAPANFPNSGALNFDTCKLVTPTPETQEPNFHFQPDLFFASSRPTSHESAQSLEPAKLFQLWQAFIDNVQPVSNLLHVPSTQRLILEASHKPAQQSPGQLALLSTIHLAAVESMSNEDCHELIGSSRVSMLERLCVSTQQALVEAKVMSKPDWTVLQALVLFLLVVRQHCDIQSMWLLVGIAVRCAQRLGLHRERTLEKMSVFQAELSRRLWWQILLMNRHYTNLCGDMDIADTANATPFDTKRPLNIQDADLHQDMKIVPVERIGATEMMFCAARYEIGEFVQSFGLKSKEISFNREQAVLELENTLDKKFIAFCDKSVPTQLLTMFLIRTAVCRLKLTYCFPSIPPGPDGRISQSDKDEIWQACLAILQIQNASFENKSLQQYHWHTRNFYYFEALFPVIRALAFDTLETSKAVETWKQVSLAYEHKPELLRDKDSEYFNALNALTVKAWDRHAWSQIRQGFEVVTPFYIESLRREEISDASHSADAITTQIPAETMTIHASNNATRESFEGLASPTSNLLDKESSVQAWDHWLNLVNFEEFFPY